MSEAVIELFFYSPMFLLHTRRKDGGKRGRGREEGRQEGKREGREEGWKEGGREGVRGRWMGVRSREGESKKCLKERKKERKYLQNPQ